MRDLLQRIRTRVDRLVAGVECNGPHVLTHVSMVPLGEPTPHWPPPDRAATCGTCGAALEYIHLLHIELAADPSPRPIDAPPPAAGSGLTH